MKDDLLTWEDHIGGISDFYAWQKDMLKMPRLSDQHEGAFVAYVGAFARPHNIRPIVESLLRTPSVGKIIVSENRPYCLRGYWKPNSTRVTVAHHDQVQDCHRRFVHLTREQSDYFLVTDDDLFLSPRQLEHVCNALIQSPVSPKGICGQRWDGKTLHSNVRSAGDIDVINRLYAFTKKHLETHMALSATCLKKSTHDNKRMDDLLLSLSGSRMPAIVPVGHFLDCTSQGRKKIALWREHGFMNMRNAAFADLLPLRSF